MQDTDAPVTALCHALARINSLLLEWRQGSSGDPDALRAQLEKDLGVCIESVQFHDRLIQQLTTIRTVLETESVKAESRNAARAPAGSVELF